MNIFVVQGHKYVMYLSNISMKEIFDIVFLF